jgi:hypothetical protein
LLEKLDLLAPWPQSIRARTAMISHWPKATRGFLSSAAVTTSSWLLVAILVATALATTMPFMTGRVLGARDSVWYRYLAYDAILQARHGTFPVYVGQSDFNFTEYPLIMSLLFYQVFVALDALFLDTLSINQTFNLTTIAFGLMYTLVPFAALRQLLPNRPWHCAVLAILFAFVAKLDQPPLHPRHLSELFRHTNGSRRPQASP